MKSILKLSALFSFFLLLSCTPQFIKNSKLNSDEKKQLIKIYRDTKKGEGYYKVGKPYQIKGVIYSPQNFTNFEEHGKASWYGKNFHGKKTANGEIFSKNELTAAHPTLPLPSVVRVTNLANKKTVIVKVNDRGPFSKSRIIDVSQKASEALDFRHKGVAKVKVEFLPKETEMLLKKLK